MKIGKFENRQFKFQDFVLDDKYETAFIFSNNGMGKSTFASKFYPWQINGVTDSWDRTNLNSQKHDFVVNKEIITISSEILTDVMSSSNALYNNGNTKQNLILAPKINEIITLENEINELKQKISSKKEYDKFFKKNVVIKYSELKILYKFLYEKAFNKNVVNSLVTESSNWKYNSTNDINNKILYWDDLRLFLINAKEFLGQKVKNENFKCSIEPYKKMSLDELNAIYLNDRELTLLYNLSFAL